MDNILPQRLRKLCIRNTPRGNYNRLLADYPRSTLHAQGCRNMTLPNYRLRQL